MSTLAGLAGERVGKAFGGVSSVSSISTSSEIGCGREEGEEGVVATGAALQVTGQKPMRHDTELRLLTVAAMQGACGNYIATHHGAPALRKSSIRIRGASCDTPPGKRLGKSIWRSGAALPTRARWMALLEPLAKLSEAALARR